MLAILRWLYQSKDMTIKGLEDFGSSVGLERKKRERNSECFNRLGKYIIREYSVPSDVVRDALSSIELSESDNYENLGLDTVKIIEAAYMRTQRTSRQ